MSRYQKKDTGIEFFNGSAWAPCTILKAYPISKTYDVRLGPRTKLRVREDQLGETYQNLKLRRANGITPKKDADSKLPISQAVNPDKNSN